MLFSALVSLSLLVASVAASPTPALDARAATTSIYMRIEGPTKTIYEKTLSATTQKTLTNSGHTATCKWTRNYIALLLIDAFDVRQRLARNCCRCDQSSCAAGDGAVL